MSKKPKNEFTKPYKIEKEFELNDLLETDHPEEKDACIDYVGRYVLRRMRFGQRRLAKAKLVRIQAHLAELKDANEDTALNSMEVATDLTEWQNEMLVHTIVVCPAGEQPQTGWGKEVEKIREFVFNMPDKLGTELLDLSIDLNDTTKEEQKN